MAIFNIQTVNEEIHHDFAFHLNEAIRYQNWLANGVAHEIIRSDHMCMKSDAIPVGSLEYVFTHLSTHYGIQPVDIQPINIPNQLMKPAFLKRRCLYLNKSELTAEQRPLFIKSASTYKSFIDITDAFHAIPDDRYLVSEPVDIESEWRCFVGPEGLLGMQHYQGDFTLFPDVSLVREMIHTYTDTPRYYSLDIGINEKGTFVIEVHPMVSCGLYGFNNPRILPQMMINGYQYMRDQALQQKNKREQAI